MIGPHRAEAQTRFELRAFFTGGTEPLREDPVTGASTPQLHSGP